MKTFCVLLALSVVLALSTRMAEARIVRYCQVSYETREGWSIEYLHEVTFQSGTELNTATKSLQFSSFENYALVWYAPDQVAIIKLGAFLVTGREFLPRHFRQMFLISESVEGEQVNVRGERNWRIKGKEFFKFIDPRTARDEPDAQPVVAAPVPSPTPEIPPTGRAPRRPLYVVPECYAGDKPPPKTLRCEPRKSACHAAGYSKRGRRRSDTT